MNPPAQQPPPPPAGTVLLGKYQVGRLLGRGSFAKVHHARCIETNKSVAIKIIDKKKTVDASMEPRIIREIDAMRRLHRHPNILNIHEVMATKSKIYLVMDLASGGDLFSKVLRRGKLPEQQVRLYFQQLVSALSFCHRHGVAHRDIKPQNLLLDHRGNLMVSDFGLSAISSSATSGGLPLLQTACGTPAYTAPEVVARRGYDGAKADAWSCGVILFVLLAGYVPFDDSNIVAMYRKVQKREYHFPSWVSKPARSVIYQMLDPNPETRMSIEAVSRTSWFRKSLDDPDFNDCTLEWDSFSSLHKESKFDGGLVTAFDVISLSSGLDLSGLFEAKKREVKRFISRVSVEGVMEKVRKVGEGLGYRVERRKGGGAVVGLRRENTVVVVEAVEIAEEVVVVEVKVSEGEAVAEECSWEDLKNGLGEIVVSWHNDVM